MRRSVCTVTVNIITVSHITTSKIAAAKSQTADSCRQVEGLQQNLDKPIKSENVFF